MGNMMQQMQSAMSRAQNMETELKQELVTIDKGPIKAIFDGTGEIQKLTIDPSIVSADDVEMLEDMIVSVIKDGFQRSTDLRNSKVQSIMPDLPNIPGITG